MPIALLGAFFVVVEKTHEKRHRHESNQHDHERTPFTGRLVERFRPIETQESRVGSGNASIYSNMRTLRSCDIHIWKEARRCHVSVESSLQSSTRFSTVFAPTWWDKAALCARLRQSGDEKP